MGTALSVRNVPSKRLPRVARRWDIPPIVERQTPVPVMLEGVRSKIVKTPAGERVLWGNRQGTVTLEEALVWAGAERAHFFGLAESVKLLNKAIPLIQQVAQNMASKGADGQGLIDFAKNLSSLTASAVGGAACYIDADDTRSNAEVRESEMHEAGIHLVQIRIGRGKIELVSAAWMRADPDFRQIAKSAVGRNYVKDKERLAAEAAAYVLSGAYAKMGYIGSGALNRAQRFAERYLGELASLYGINAIKQFRDTAPQMAVSIERVVDQYGRDKTQRTVPRGKGGTKGHNGGGFETSGGADSISETERTALREYLQETWKGRETAENAVAPTSSLEALKPGRGGTNHNSGLNPIQEDKPVVAEPPASHPSLQPQSVDPGNNNIHSNVRSVDVPTFDSQVDALTFIANIETIDPTKTWRELASLTSLIAREALSNAGTSALDREVAIALQEISGLQTREQDGHGRMLSDPNRVNEAVKIASATIEMIESQAPTRAVGIDVAEINQSQVLCEREMDW